MTKVLKGDDPTVSLDTSRLKESIPHITTGSLVIDFLIGGSPNQFGVSPCPGWPRGRIVNLYGTAGAGKTTLSLTTAAKVCEKGGTVGYIDWEHEVEPRYAAALGVPITDSTKFTLYQPDTLEEGIKIMVTLAAEGVDLIVLDSVGAAVPNDYFTQDIADEEKEQRVGQVARKWSRFVPRFKGIITKSGTCLIAVSQLRKTISGGMGPETDAQGGEAWKFYSSIRMGLRVVQKEKVKARNPLTQEIYDKIVGIKVRARLDKCKVSDAVHGELDFYLRSGFGIDNERTIIEIALATKTIQKGGAWLEWTMPDGNKIRGQGMSAFRKALSETKGAVDGLFAATLPKISVTKSEVDQTGIELDENPPLEDLISDVMGDKPAPSSPEEPPSEVS